jgi:hypothetical protein
MFEIPELPFDPQILNTGSTIGSLPWLVGILLSLLIGPFVLMLGVRIMGSSSTYGECFVTWLIVLVIITVIPIISIIFILIVPLIGSIIVLVLILVLCCYYPKFIANRHNLKGWYNGLLALIIALIFNVIINWILNRFMGFIPDIQLFTL